MNSGREDIQLFLDLIRVSLGCQERFSVIPTAQQWQQLYVYAMQQALIGVCFTGIRRLKEQGMAIPQSLYMQWLSRTVLIEQKNQKMNQLSIDICRKISNSSFDCCLLKGQSLASLYSGEFCMLRQPGDIDVWLLASHMNVIRWGQENGGIYFYDYHHADFLGIKNVEVELHYRPTISRNLLRNIRLQHWVKKEGNRLIMTSDNNFPMPNKIFNLILVLNHNLWHLLYEGVGLRQTMDLYYVLLHNDYQNDVQVKELLKYFNLIKFAAANMWVLGEIFSLPKEKMVVAPNEKQGRFLLHEIMLAGNFGHFDKRLKKEKINNRFMLMVSWLKHSLRLFRCYPIEVLWTPLGIIYISLWRRLHYMFDGVKLNMKV